MTLQTAADALAQKAIGQIAVNQENNVLFPRFDSAGGCGCSSSCA